MIHGKTHTDLLAYEAILGLFTAGGSTASTNLGFSALKNSGDEIVEYSGAWKKAWNWLRGRGFKADKVNKGKFGDTKGKGIGMTTEDGKTGFRVEYDERSGAHINVFSKKEKDHIYFDGNESTVKKIQKRFQNLFSKGKE